MDQAVSSSTAELVQYGVLGIAVIAFAWVIAFLYKRNEARVEKYEAAVKEMATERAGWAVREQQIRADVAKQVADAADDYAKELRDLRTQSQAREDQIRREYTDLMETVSESIVKQNAALANVMDKVYDRLLSPRVIPKG